MRIVAAIGDVHLGEHLLQVIGTWAATNQVGVDMVTVVDHDALHETVKDLGFAYALTPEGTWSGTKLDTPAPKPGFVEDRGQAIERARSSLVDALDELGDRHLGGAPHTEHVAFEKDVAGAICAYAEEVGAAAIAVGTRGRGAIKAALFGSVAEDVVRRSNIPVLVVRDTMPVPDPATVA